MNTYDMKLWQVLKEIDEGSDAVYYSRDSSTLWRGISRDIMHRPTSLVNMDAMYRRSEERMTPEDVKQRYIGAVEARKAALKEALQGRGIREAVEIVRSAASPVHLAYRGLSGLEMTYILTSARSIEESGMQDPEIAEAYEDDADLAMWAAETLGVQLVETELENAGIIHRARHMAELIADNGRRVVLLTGGPDATPGQRMLGGIAEITAACCAMEGA